VLIDQGSQALRVGTGGITMITNNTERINISSGGNIGIGTTNPLQGMLQVAGRAMIGYKPDLKKGVLIDNEDAYGGSSCIQAVTKTLLVDSLAINPAGGVVGIGTTNPSVGPGDTPPSIPNAVLTLRSGAVGQNGGTSRLSIGGGGNHYAAIEGKHTEFGSTTLSFLTTQSYNTNSGNPEVRMAINHLGNVSIGADTSIHKLTIRQEDTAKASIHSIGQYSASGSIYGYQPILYHQSLGPASYNNISAEIGVIPVYNGSWIEGPLARMDFKLNSVASEANSWGPIPNITVMSLTGWGNVGIGTSAPRARLQIDQGFGNNNNGLIITNSNYGSDQHLNISMVNAGPSYFNSHAKIQGVSTGVAYPITPILLQPDGGTVGVGDVALDSVNLTVKKNICVMPITFTVGGNDTTWYKVKIGSHTHAAASFSITRAVHDDGLNEGSIALEVQFRSVNCGNGSQHLAWKYSNYSPNGRYFVGRVSIDEEPDAYCSASACYVYLLGSRSYYFVGYQCFVEYYSADGTSAGTIGSLSVRDAPFSSSPSVCSSDTRTGINFSDGNVGIGTQVPKAKLHVNGNILARGGCQSWQGTHIFDSSNPTWSPGDPIYWPWDGLVFYITFRGQVSMGADCIFGHYLICHSRWGAGSNSAGSITSIVQRKVGLNSITDGGLSFTFNADNAQYVQITVTVIA
jgi:hypothetical protein